MNVSCSAQEGTPVLESGAFSRTVRAPWICPMHSTRDGRDEELQPALTSQGLEIGKRAVFGMYGGEEAGTAA